MQWCSGAGRSSATAQRRNSAATHHDSRAPAVQRRSRAAVQQCSNAPSQPCAIALVQRCSGAEVQRCSDAAEQRSSGAAMQRCGDAAVQQLRCTIGASGSPASCRKQAAESAKPALPKVAFACKLSATCMHSTRERASCQTAGRMWPARVAHAQAHPFSLPKRAQCYAHLLLDPPPPQ